MNIRNNKKIIDKIFFTFLFILGAFLIIFSLTYQVNIEKLKYFDWKVQNGFNLFLNHFINLNVLPYHGSFYESVKDLNDIDIAKHEDFSIRYFALGITYVPITSYLLKFISIENYTIFNHFFSYCIGFLGLLLWRNHFKFTRLSVIIYFFFILFNGSIVSKISVGHLIFTGLGQYFYPIIFYLFYKIFFKIGKKLKNIYIAYFIFCILILSSFGNIISIYHIFLAIIILKLFFLGQILDFLKIYFFSICILAYYLLPTIFFSPYLDSPRVVFAGYGFLDYIDKELSIIDHDIYNNIFIKVIFHLKNIFNQIFIATSVYFNPNYDEVWEWNFFLGYPFLFIMIVFNIYFYIYQKNTINKKIFLFLVIFLILSISLFSQKLFFLFGYILNYKLPVPDRLPTRLFQFIFYLVLLIFIINFDSFYKKIRKEYFKKIIILIFPILIYPIIQNYINWLPYNFKDSNLAALSLDDGRVNQASKIYYFADDALYIDLVKYGFSITILTTFLLVLFIFYNRKKSS